MLSVSMAWCCYPSLRCAILKGVASGVHVHFSVCVGVCSVYDMRG